MTPYTQKYILDIFTALPNQRGCPTEEMDLFQRQWKVEFPEFYRWIMRLDAERLANTGDFVPLARLPQAKEEAQQLLEEDRYDFRLAPEHVVFAWDDIRAFQFFEAIGGQDVVVWEFDYYANPKQGLPVVVADSLANFYAEKLQAYLKL